MIGFILGLIAGALVYRQWGDALEEKIEEWRR